MQPKLVNGSLVRFGSTYRDRGLTGIVISVKETNTSSLGTSAQWYSHVYYVFFNDCVVHGPLFGEELERL